MPLVGLQVADAAADPAALGLGLRSFLALAIVGALLAAMVWGLKRVTDARKGRQLLSVESAKLVGAADFVQVVSGIHQMMPQYDATREATLKFLQVGYFTDAAAMQPIVAAR